MPPITAEPYEFDFDPRTAALVAAVLSFVGLIRGAQVGWAVNPDIALGSVLVAGMTGFLAVRKPAEAAEPAVIPAAAEVPTS